MVVQTPGNGVDNGFIAFGGMSSGGYISYGMYIGLRKTEAISSASSVRLQIGQLGKL